MYCFKSTYICGNYWEHVSLGTLPWCAKEAKDYDPSEEEETSTGARLGVALGAI